MHMTPPRRLSAEELVTLAREADTSTPCADCGPLRCEGWESMPGSFDRRALVRVGTIRDEAVTEPTLEEHHPAGTNSWSPDAPIALSYYPYNRCDVWRCASCRRAFLRYTEYGGYYEDERVRELDSDLIVGSTEA